MIVYTSAAILYVAFTWITYLFHEQYQKENDEKLKRINKILFITFFIVSLLPFTLIAGLRYNVGTDYNYTYAPHFINIFSEPDCYREKPFVWLNMLLRLMTSDPVWLFLIMALLFSLFIQLTIIKISNNWMISAALVFLCNLFFVSLNQSRQMVGVAIIMYACTFAFEKKVGLYFLFVAIAFCFHLTTIIFLPLYFIFNSKIKRNIWFLILAGLILFAPLIVLGLKRLVSFTPYDYYLTDPKYADGQALVAYTLASLVVEVVAIAYSRKIIAIHGIKGFSLILLNTIGLTICFFSFFLRIQEMFARFYLLFSWSQLFLIPIILTVEEQKNFAWAYVFLMMFAVGTGSGYIIFIQHHHEIFPYRTILFR